VDGRGESYAKVLNLNIFCAVQRDFFGLNFHLNTNKMFHSFWSVCAATLYINQSKMQQKYALGEEEGGQPAARGTATLLERLHPRV
jgi:hypothetical protein